MADSLQPGIKVAPTFVDGESSPAAKFTSIGAQLMRATRRLELAFGDAHDESYPYSSLNDARLSVEWGRSRTTDAALSGTATRSLDIANLARLIGPASNLNPKLPAGTVTITEDIPADVHEFTLKYPPVSITSSDDTAIDVGQVQTDPSDLAADGDFYVDGSTIYTYRITNGDTITYTLTPSAWGSGPNYTGATFNVIPDLNQLEAGGDGCTVSPTLDGDGRHTITLPVCTHLSSTRNGLQIALGAYEPFYNEQIILPRVLVDNYDSEEVIPAGFMYLRNWTTGEVYDDAVYYYSAEDTVLISGVNLEDEVAAGDLFVLVTVGTDICTSIDDLRQKMAYHTHDRTFGESAIDAEDIVGWTKEAPDSGQYTKSNIPGNYAPQYLHRDGYNSGTDSGLNDENVMRGDLALGVDGASAGGYTSDSGSSFKLRFLGANAGGQNPYLQKDSQGALILDADMDAVGDVYDDPNLKGIRVRNGYFVPEKGMVSGLNSSVSGVSGEKPVQILNITHSESVDTGSPHNIDLTSYGLDPSVHHLVNAAVSLGMPFTADGVGDAYYWGYFGYEWGWFLGSETSVSPDPFSLDLKFIGAGWGAVVDLDVKILVFYYEEA